MSNEKEITLEELKELTNKLDDGVVITISLGGDDDGQ